MLTKYPNIILNRKAKPVKSAEQALQIKRMLQYSMAKECTWGVCLGLAAPQVGESLRAFIANGIFMANPEILSTANFRVQSSAEGCYSLTPGKQYYVKRRDSVLVRYWDENMIEQRISFKGRAAHVIQHELDHLDGITLIERAKL